MTRLVRPRQVGGPAEELLVEVVPPPTDRLSERYARCECVHQRAGSTSVLAETVEAIALGAAAEVEADDLDVANERVAAAVDLLLVFKETRHNRFQTPTFGMPGDVFHVVQHYLQFDSNRAGFRRAGHYVGWTFDDTELARWSNNETFRAIAANIGASAPTDGHRRALLGVQLLARGVRERRPAIKLVLLVAGLEAMLLRRERAPQTYRLARNVAYFGCGRHADDLCGRDRPTCTYLATEPLSKQTAHLKELQRLARSGPPWLCSEWLRVIDWYDARSQIVHGGRLDLDREHIVAAEYWILQWLTQPILDWLMTHLDDPVTALEDALDQLPAHQIGTPSCRYRTEALVERVGDMRPEHLSGLAGACWPTSSASVRRTLWITAQCAASRPRWSRPREVPCKTSGWNTSWLL